MNVVLKGIKGIGLLVFGVFLILGFSILLAYPTKWVVNSLFTPTVLVALFGGYITVYKAWLLNFLGGLIFKGTNTVSTGGK